MPLFKRTDAADALNDLLEKERSALLAGNLETILRLKDEKERLLARFAGSSPDETTLRHMREKANRNQHLLVAAARGIKSVSQRLKDLRAQKANLRTYDKSGHHQEISNRARGFERRA